MQLVFELNELGTCASLSLIQMRRTQPGQFRPRKSVGNSATALRRRNLLSLCVYLAFVLFDALVFAKAQIGTPLQYSEWFNLTVAVKQAGVYTIDLLYTSNRGGKISLDLNGKPLVSFIDIIATKNEKETVAWRQWHHWNVMTKVAEVELPKGVCVLTLHVVAEGNMNFAY